MCPHDGNRHGATSRLELFLAPLPPFKLEEGEEAAGVGSCSRRRRSQGECSRLVAALHTPKKLSRSYLRAGAVARVDMYLFVVTNTEGAFTQSAAPGKHLAS